MTVMKQMRQLALCALFAAAIQSHQALSQTQDETPTATPASASSSGTPSETPSLTPIATQVRPSDAERPRFPTPFSHQPKFDVRLAPVPAKPRPTPEGVSGRSPWLRGPRALRGLRDGDGGEDSSSDSQV
ncbi:hypothetical protein Gpo141_00012951 [Globisporangium polare]